MRMFDRLDRQFAGNACRGEKCEIIGTALAIGLGVASAVGSVASSAIGAHAAGSAANAQVDAANHAADVQHQDAQDALAFQKSTYADQQKNLAPWLSTGTSALANLSSLLGVLPKDRPATPGTLGTAAIPGSTQTVYPELQSPSGDFGPYDNVDGLNVPGRVGADGGTVGDLSGFGAGVGNGIKITSPGQPATEGTPGDPGSNLSSLVNPALGAPGSLSQGWTGKFVAPTDVTEQNDPGYQFRLSQGQKTIEAGAAARGTLLSGGTEKALTRYGQDYASNEYGNVYDRAFNQYKNNFNEFQIGNTNTYNRLASLAGLGQQTAEQLNNTGSQTANNVSNILLTSGQQIGNNINNAGAARASGYVGTGNAIAGGLNGASNSLSQLLLLKSLMGGAPAGGGYYGAVGG